MKAFGAVVVSVLLGCATATVAWSDSARLWLADNGHYMTEANINGRRIGVMVDTGATSVALSLEDALTAGFRSGDLDFDVPVATANGTVQAAKVKIRRIAIGSISVEDVEGLVLPRGALSGTLLGMSFLSRLHSYEVQDGVLHLRE